MSQEEDLDVLDLLFSFTSDTDLTHASYNIGVFLCSTCASIHATIGTHISKVKHLNFDHWEESQVERLKQVGNAAAKQKYEQRVPNWLQRPRE